MNEIKNNFDQNIPLYPKEAYSGTKNENDQAKPEQNFEQSNNMQALLPLLLKMMQKGESQDMSALLSSLPLGNSPQANLIQTLATNFTKTKKKEPVKQDSCGEKPFPKNEYVS